MLFTDEFTWELVGGFLWASEVLGAVHMSRASPANRADSILSPFMRA